MAKLAGIEYTRRLSDDETSKFFFLCFWKYFLWSCETKLFGQILLR